MATVNNDTASNPIKQRILNTLNETEENAKAKKEIAEAEYQNVYAQYQKYCAQKDAIYSQLKYDPKNADLKAQYKAADSTVYSADTAWTCARYKVEDTNSYYSKICNSTFFANT